MSYFCHQCSQEIQPIMPDLICPNCSGGFIEKLEGGSLSSSTSTSASNSPTRRPDVAAARFMELFDQFVESVENRSESPGFSSSSAASGAREEGAAPGPGPAPSSVDSASASASSASSSAAAPPPTATARLLRSGGEGRNPRGTTVVSIRRMNLGDRGQRAGQGSGAPPQVDAIIQQMLSGLGATVVASSQGGFPVQMLNLHGNPGDYAWGAQGLDTIITQLLNNIEGTGPPPAEKDKIEALPVLHLKPAHIENGLECAVCKEEFSVDEIVKKLPCTHLFHPDCIVPWLELHNSCPVCRKNLDGDDTSRQTDDSANPDNDPSRNVFDFQT